MMHNLYERCHSLYVRSSDGRILSYLAQQAYEARDRARDTGEPVSQARLVEIDRTLQMVEQYAAGVRAVLLGISADVEELRRDIADAIAKLPASTEGDLYADAYRNVIAHRRDADE